MYISLLLTFQLKSCNSEGNGLITVLISSDNLPTSEYIQLKFNLLLFYTKCYSDPKPGTCPATDGAIGTCVEECLHDADCDGGHKCCSNGCGHVCVEPEPSKFILKCKHRKSVI